MSQSASHDVSSEFADGSCCLTYIPLDVQSIISKVQSDEAGAVAVFIGTTRNNFQGKSVVRLEYEAYSKLAIKTMTDILHHKGEQPIISSVVHHRLGVVPVGEPSIVIAVSSAHRKEAFVECERILEEVKNKAQIWKREFYEGESSDMAEWKANNL